ncbi:uncharacterized protein [Watersipora subatra]|uniref:uncharacterized protein n=1 Tax=Watersipora subatra TaxID=2589382 RepID=UPI00355C16CC
MRAEWKAAPTGTSPRPEKERSPLVCWECGSKGHPLKECPNLRKRVPKNSDGPRQSPPPTKGKRDAEATAEGKAKGAVQTTSTQRTQEATCGQALDRPHSTSYFPPGKVESRALQFLVDTGCTTNLLNRRVFNRLPEAVRNRLEASHSHGLLADGTRLLFYGVVHLPIRLRNEKTEKTFVISQISEDAILGMPFLTANQCALEFDRPVVKVDGRALACTDRHGWLL